MVALFPPIIHRKSAGWWLAGCRQNSNAALRDPVTMYFPVECGVRPTPLGDLPKATPDVKRIVRRPAYFFAEGIWRKQAFLFRFAKRVQASASGSSGQMMQWQMHDFVCSIRCPSEKVEVSYEAVEVSGQALRLVEERSNARRGPLGLNCETNEINF